MAQNLANTSFTPQRTYCFGYGAFWGGSGSVRPLGPVFPERVSRSTRARFKLRTSWREVTCPKHLQLQFDGFDQTGYCIATIDHSQCSTARLMCEGNCTLIHINFKRTVTSNPNSDHTRGQNNSLNHNCARFIGNKFFHTPQRSHAPLFVIGVALR